MPDASVIVLTSRLRPGLDGGYAVATIQRAELLAKAGLPVTVATVDLHPDYKGFLEEFRRIGLASKNTRIRNFLEEVRSSPEIIRNAAKSILATTTSFDNKVVPEEKELDNLGIPWREVFRHEDGSIAFTDFFDGEGILLFRLPYLDQPDWWRAPIVIDVFEAADNNQCSTRIGGLAGFGALYRAWWDLVISQTRERKPESPIVAIAEARQVGELFLGYPGVHLIHTVHSAHTLAPHNWDSPMDQIWSGWIETADKYDAVVWLTEQQRLDVHKLPGKSDLVSYVIPNPVNIPSDLESRSNSVDENPSQKPLRAIMITRLVSLKRVDHAIRAWQGVTEAFPNAQLDIYGAGPEQDKLQTLIASLKLEDRVTLHGYVENAREQARTSTCHILTSSYEGQPLVIAEAMARGCPSISYEINYGPSEMIKDGLSGILVPSGEIDSLASAIIELFGNPHLAEALSAESVKWAKSAGPDQSIASWHNLLAQVLAKPPRAGA